MASDTRAMTPTAAPNRPRFTRKYPRVGDAKPATVEPLEPRGE
jgi:hypothetical protein